MQSKSFIWSKSRRLVSKPLAYETANGRLKISKSRIGPELARKKLERTIDYQRRRTENTTDKIKRAVNRLERLNAANRPLTQKEQAIVGEYVLSLRKTIADTINREADLVFEKGSTLEEISMKRRHNLKSMSHLIMSKLELMEMNGVLSKDFLSRYWSRHYE